MNKVDRNPATRPREGLDVFFRFPDSRDTMEKEKFGEIACILGIAACVAGLRMVG